MAGSFSLSEIFNGSALGTDQILKKKKSHMEEHDNWLILKSVKRFAAEVTECE